MRYSDFKIVESKLDEVPDDGNRAGQEPNAQPEPTGLEAGPPYPPEQSEAVKALQSRLEELGYSVGSTGIDGKYGPRTSRAVAAFKRDNNIQDTNRGTSLSDEELSALSSANRVETPTPTGNETGGSARFELPPLSDTSDVQGAVGEVLDFIGRYEARGQYDMLNGGTRNPAILDMTVAEVLRYQRTAPWGSRGTSSAIGRYQYVRATLEWVTGQMGVNRNTQKFDEAFQDRLCIFDARRRCGLDQWLNGSIDSTTFSDRLAQVWSSIPNRNNRSAHAGIGNNRRGVNLDQAVAQLDAIRNDNLG